MRMAGSPLCVCCLRTFTWALRGSGFFDTTVAGEPDEAGCCCFFFFLSSEDEDDDDDDDDLDDLDLPAPEP